MENIENRLKDAIKLSDTQISEAHLKKTLLSARQELCRKSKRERIKFKTFLLQQIRFIGWKIWLVQGLMLAAVCSMLSISFGNILFHNQEHIAMLLSGIAILILMMAIPFIHRALRYKMHEIEVATYFSSIKLLTAKLLIITVGDIFMLGGIFLLTILKTQLNTGSVLLYLVFPFLLASYGCLYLMGHISAERFLPCCTGMCVLLFSGMILLKRFCPQFFHQTLSAGWIAICIVLLLFCISQYRYIIYRSDYTEMQLG